MAVFTVRPTTADTRIANAIAAHTDVPTEETAEALTWGADEHVLIALAAAWWLSPEVSGANNGTLPTMF